MSTVGADLRDIFKIFFEPFSQVAPLPGAAFHGEIEDANSGARGFAQNISKQDLRPLIANASQPHFAYPPDEPRVFVKFTNNKPHSGLTGVRAQADMQWLSWEWLRNERQRGNDHGIRVPEVYRDLAYAKDILKGNNTFVNEPIWELPEDYGFDRHGLIVRRRFAASNNDQDEFPTPTDPRSASQLSSEAQGDIARDCNVTPAPSGQGPPSPSSRLTTTPEAINFAAESQSSLRQCSTHTSPTEYNRSTSTPVPASSSAAPGLTANETSPQSSSSLVEISQSQSSISENHNQHECTSLTTLSAVPVVKTIGCNGASRLPVAFSPSSPSSKSRQRGSRSVESPCIISEPAVSPTSPSSSSISYRLLPSSPLATTKSHNSPEEFSHDAKSSIDTAIKEEPSQTVTVAFSSPVEVTNPTRSPSTDPNPAFSPPSLSMCSSLRHEANQTLTANSNCRMDGITKRAMAPHSLKSFEASTEGVRKRPGPNLHESSPKKQKGSCFVDGDRATALAVTPLHPLSSAPLLDQGTRLNDVVVNEYMHHIAEHYECCFANSFFLKGYKPEEQWKAEVGDPLKSDLVLMPVHDKNSEHWYLLAMYKFGNSLIVCFLDSLGPSPSREKMHEDTFASWVKYLFACGNKAPVKKKHVQVPHQTNAFDCGVYVLAFAQKITKYAKTFALGDDNLDWHVDTLEFRKIIASTLESIRTTTNKSAASNQRTIISSETDIPQQPLLQGVDYTEPTTSPSQPSLVQATPTQQCASSFVPYSLQCKTASSPPGLSALSLEDALKDDMAMVDM
ncbi:hypothetical protein PpBr36_06820 [Pyricularia pennisetigena]|uniref:hypothetical protein n=1 Tax=Pyricularia pennisetigena TaxID=1578925 RepID=UPI00114FA50E|nr:hypothetical protein PpBr36_06820 [Pyricularia pennisetigena]TLS25959.1 hypothetical protein PpBr36_06820 [Pyricularia pennisetigena]